jgi:catechol 2,3-dioxygenase-like lactoylglutathione lyase family enzyme
MADFKILDFNHTSFTVTALDRPIAFFTEALGFELTSRSPRGGDLIERLTGIPGASINVAFLAGPGHTVELIEYASPAEKGTFLPPMCDAGASHIALNVDDLDAAIAASVAYGFEPMGEVVAIDAGPNKGRRIVYLRSPEGITVEYLEVRGSN